MIPISTIAAATIATNTTIMAANTATRTAMLSASRHSAPSHYGMVGTLSQPATAAFDPDFLSAGGATIVKLPSNMYAIRRMSYLGYEFLSNQRGNFYWWSTGWVEKASFDRLEDAQEKLAQWGRNPHDAGTPVSSMPSPVSSTTQPISNPVTDISELGSVIAVAIGIAAITALMIFVSTL